MLDGPNRVIPGSGRYPVREAAVLFTDAHRQPGVSRYSGRRPSRIGSTAAERADSKFKSHCNRWRAIEPRPRLLELRDQSKQRRLVAVARDKLNGDR